MLIGNLLNQLINLINRKHFHLLDCGLSTIGLSTGLFLFATLSCYPQAIPVKAGDTLHINRTDSMGRKQGFWKKYDDSKKLVYAGFFKDNQPVTLMKHYFPNGKLKSELIFYNNNQSAAAHLYYENGGLMATGIYHNQERDSIWRFYSPGGKITAEETYHAGKKHGMSKTYYENGKIAGERVWKEGVENGSRKEYFENGILKSEINATNGLLNGIFKENYPAGKLYCKGKYIFDLPDSLWNYFREDGTLLVQKKYRKGELLNQDEVDKIMEKEDSLKIKKGELKLYKEGEYKEELPADTIF